MKLSINQKIINKNELGVSQAHDFKAVDISVEELATQIKKGCAFSYKFKNNHRRSQNFLCSDVIALDIDSGMKWDEALNDEYIMSYASIIYKTSSHTDENHRFRVIFQLEHTVSDPQTITYAQKGLARKYRGDLGSVDSARQFYGNNKSDPLIIGKYLPDAELQDLIEIGSDDDVEKTSPIERLSETSFRSSLYIDPDCQIYTKSGAVSKLSNLKKGQTVYCPYHKDNNPSAFVTQSKSGCLGIYCSACKKTFWPKETHNQKYNFFEFDSLVKNMLAQPALADEDDGIVHEPVYLNRVINEQYLNYHDLKFKNGIVLVKSPKGSGKTQYLKKIINDNHKKNILLIGHRRTLIRSLANELGLDCYLSLDGSSNKGSSKKKFAISVDSMTKHLDSFNKFDLVLIDESEQVFSHFISSTFDSKLRKPTFNLLMHFMSSARMSVLLDADLNNITTTAIKYVNQQRRLCDVQYVLNTYQSKSKEIDIYNSKDHLIGDLILELSLNKKIYIPTNSKKIVDELSEAIKNKFPHLKLFKITSENSNTDEVKKFLNNIKSEILNYDVVIVSPAVGSGIDISFENEHQFIDGVFGIFLPGITTHQDIDQQLSRVRNPKYVKVWISPQRFNFEYEKEAIKLDLVTHNIVDGDYVKYSWSGTPQYDLSDKFLDLQATTISAQRVSINDLKKNFIDLRIYSGSKINIVPVCPKVSEEGRIFFNNGKASFEDKRINDLLSVKDIDPNQVDELIEKRKISNLNAAENAMLEKYFLKAFYKEELTKDIIVLDSNGSYQEKLKLLDAVLYKDSYQSERTNLLRLILEKSGIYNSESGFNPTVEIKADDLTDFVNVCRDNAVIINRLCQIDIRNDIQQKPINQLNVFLKKCGLSTKKSRQIDKNNKRIYYYKLDIDKLNNCLEILKKRNQIEYSL